MKRTLTETQIAFLRDLFLREGSVTWEKVEVAEALITNGVCIVGAGISEFMEHVLDFIHKELVPDSVGVYKLSFNLEGFIKSTFVRSALTKATSDYGKVRDDMDKKVKELYALG